jgi:hypothetical protein
MKISEIPNLINGEFISDEYDDDVIECAYTSNLLSDVMAHAKEGGALITIQAHKNTVAVATLVNVTVIIICNSRPIPDDMTEAAKNEGIALIRTTENQFTVSGILYRLLNDPL